MVVFDIGAHIGTYTLLALNRVGTQGKVVAYEPHPPTRQFLLRHLAMNGCTSRAVVRDVCCGSREGTAPFYFLPDRTEGVSGLVPVNGFQRRDVAVSTVDLEVGVLGLRPDVLKIDVEGAEFDVLRGAEETLRTDRPTIFLSIHPQALAKLGHSEELVIDWLRARGYRCDVLARDHEVHVRASAADRYAGSAV
jgi:FkbM family methyltransferase